MEKIPVNIQTPIAQQHATLVRYSNQSSSRRLLLLHGAGVPGELTWTYLANYLSGWGEVLIPDFAGMGHSRFTNPAFTPRVEDYAQQIAELLNKLDWTEFDIAGYSFGGMVTYQLLQRCPGIDLCFLIEPAMLFSSDKPLIQQKAADYLSVADKIESDPKDRAAYVEFLNSVSPGRVTNEKADLITVRRLQQNHQGFAQSLRAVSHALFTRQDEFSRWAATNTGASFVGGLSHASMHGRHRLLAQESVSWQYVSVEGADHSLVFTKPRTIARAMNDCLNSAL